jgi:hypothetical protein
MDIRHAAVCIRAGAVDVPGPCHHDPGSHQAQAHSAHADVEPGSCPWPAVMVRQRVRAQQRALSAHPGRASPAAVLAAYPPRTAKPVALLTAVGCCYRREGQRPTLDGVAARQRLCDDSLSSC